MKIRNALRLLAVTLTLVVVSGCAFWQKTAKPIVSTVDDVARSMCAMFYGQQMGISVDKALETYCDLREKWAPWIDPALASMQAGATAKLGQAVPPAPTPATAVVPTLEPPVTPPVTPSTAATPAPAPSTQPADAGAPAPQPGGGK